MEELKSGGAGLGVVLDEGAVHDDVVRPSVRQPTAVAEMVFLASKVAVMNR